jgi:hypothetical protein
MRLEILPSSRKRRVLPMHVVNYNSFRDDFRAEDETELHLLEKFHAARLLSQAGDIDTFIEPIIYDPGKQSRRLTADLAGIESGNLTAVFCETQQAPSESLLKDLEMLDEAENSKAMVVYPFKADSGSIDAKFHDALETGKVVIEHLNWRDRALERAFRNVLEVMDLLCNETRVKMLLPLLERPQGKKNYREEINPKLIYENVPLLRTHKLIAELSDDLYDLTPMGKTILCEYLAFVEKVRQLMERGEKDS